LSLVGKQAQDPFLLSVRLFNAAYFASLHFTSLCCTLQWVSHHCASILTQYALNDPSLSTIATLETSSFVPLSQLRHLRLSSPPPILPSVESSRLAKSRVFWVVNGVMRVRESLLIS